MKFDVTPELASVLKAARAQYGVSSKDVAEHLKRSPSYLSKLESGGVRTIEAETLRDMLTFIGGGADFYREVLPYLGRLLRASVGQRRLMNQVWFLQFDVVERPVDVPGAMAADLRRMLDDLGASTADVCALINANIDSELTAAYPSNQVLSVEYESGSRLLIRSEYDETAVQKVFSGEEPQPPYILVHTIVHALFRMQRFPGATEKLPPQSAVALLIATAEYMEKWNIHSLSGFSHYLTSDEFVQGQLPLVGDEPGVVGRINAQLAAVLKNDSLNALGAINTFQRTWEWDPGFALKILELPFSDLGQMSYTNKAKLLAELQAVLARYEALDEFERRLEAY